MAIRRQERLGREGGEERRRMAGGSRRVAGDWKSWGPYLSERAWGTVREDYSADGAAWEYFRHEHARSRAYRWNEDGLGGLCDLRQRLCFAFAFWNGRDPILKERIFGLTNDEGNHGEDAKEYWWYLDSTPTHSWMRWRYHYPQTEFPYANLVEENRRRGRDEPEYELADTGVFGDGRYWVIAVDYAKAGPEDLCVRVTVGNRGPEPAELHVVPTLWFRNTWSWGDDERRPCITAEDIGLVADHYDLGRFVLTSGPGPGGAAGTPLFCENDTNVERLYGLAGRTRYPKDGVNDHIVSGMASVNPLGVGTKAAVWHRLTVPGGGEAELRLRLRRLASPGNPPADLGAGFERVLTRRRAEADQFYTEVIPACVPAEERLVARQAFAGMLWGKQFFHYDVDRWLQGDPAGPPPPPVREQGRNARWRHLNNLDVISMPDAWEYPWYAAWDLAFHAVVLAHVDPDYAKHQLTLLCREWYMHPNGQLPAYEWAFDDVNPPVHAWAGLRVFQIDGARDYRFLEALFHKLLINFTWWVNRKDVAGDNVFEGGFLGLDNIGPFDRSADLPAGGRLEQSDATAWMAMFCLNMLEIALILADRDDSYEDVATKFFEHFAYISTAMNARGLWDEDLDFYVDVLRCDGGEVVPLGARSMVGLVPLFASTVLDAGVLDRHPDFAFRVAWFVQNKPEYSAVVGKLAGSDDAGSRLLAMVSPDRLRVILQTMLAEEHFLSDHGLRSLSRCHRDEPFVVEAGGAVFRLDYEPAESQTAQFGGNSNWRGPVWSPLNFLTLEALRRYHAYLGDAFLIEHPVGTGREIPLDEVADDLASRLVGLFLTDVNGRRPVFGDAEPFGSDPAWRDLLLFCEYFDGDAGRGLGATHQTGWTGLVANLIVGRGRRR